MNRRTHLFLKKWVAGGFCILIYQFAYLTGYGIGLNDEVQRFEELVDVYYLVLKESLHEKNPDVLIKSAISGMVKGLDAYSEILTKSEYEMLEAQVLGKYPGVGINIQKDGKKYVVTQVYRNSPAALSGLKTGDIILKIKNISLDHLSEQEIKHLIIGKVGSELAISFVRSEKVQDIQNLILKLDWIKTNSVDFFEFKPGIALFEVHQFQKDTPEAIRKHLNKKRYRAVILDLRNNPGGLLLSAVEVAELFVSAGKIVETRNRRNQLLQRYISRRDENDQHPFLVVLINRFSASASEIVAGAIKDRKAGILVGESSFGKGVIQSVFPIGDRLFVKLTTAKYYTPSGISFDQVGVRPQYYMKDSVSFKKYGIYDEIYRKALDIIRSRKIAD